MPLPTELVLRIIHEVIDTPAVFIFNVERGEVPHPPVFPQSGQIRFRPLLTPPTDHQGHYHRGTWESQVSKTIRSLLLTNKWVRVECLKRLQGIAVPTVSGHAIVRFNPRKHIICLYDVNHTRHQFLPNPEPTYRHRDFECWIRRDSDLWNDLDFDIEHLAFMPEGMGGKHETLAFFRTVFPSLRHIYSAVTEIPRKDPSEPIDVICPARDATHTLSPMFLYMARKCWDHARNKLWFSMMRASYDWVCDVEFEGLVLI